MSETNIWLISPRDPLIFRNGKPFTAAPGSRAETLPIPFPGTISGAVRTMSWTDTVTGAFDENRISDPYNIRGPLLVELDASDNVIDWFFIAPTDAVFFQTKDKSKTKADCFDLKPMPTLPGILLDNNDMVLCGLEKKIKRKSFKSPPTFWNWVSLREWLLHPVSKRGVELHTVGIGHLPVEYRTHVAMENSLQSAKDEGLFQTSGIEFDYKAQSEPTIADVRRFGMVAVSDLDIHGGGLGYLGGEKRLVDWVPVDTQTPIHTCPKEIRDDIVRSGYCRLLLATPAYFSETHHPGKVLSAMGAEVIAIVNNRFQTVSGWDYQTRKPKPTKHLVPAGSVFFLKLSDDLAKRNQFVDQVWGKNLGDDPQMSFDGYGLSLLGTWDGKTRSMNMEESDD